MHGSKLGAGRETMGGTAHLFDMPGPRPFRNPSEKERWGMERADAMKVCTYIHYISSRTCLMTDWISNGYAASNDSDALI